MTGSNLQAISALLQAVKGYAIYNLKCRTKLGSWSSVVCERIISFYRFGRIAGYTCLSWIFIRICFCGEIRRKT